MEIPSTEFTFDRAVKKIIELYMEWNPEKIYLDRGYGEYQVETLKKQIGGDTVVGVAFNENLKVVDPIENKETKKRAKHFMVNQTAVLLERDQLRFPEADDLLWKQMENYQVVRRSSTGKPVYTSENEHALDALMLTVLGFVIEYPEVTKILEKKRVARIMRKVDKRLGGNREDKVFQHQFTEHTKDEDLQGEPDYVKHMKAIEKASRRGVGSTLGRAWSGRGSTRRRSGRSKF